ncbi:MAG: TonB family protein, partial [Acidobacteria bacterium]
WFNPLLWVACRRLRDEGERACDDAVLNGGSEPAEYAAHLLEIAKSVTRLPVTPAIAMARPSSLEGRISAMLNANVSRHPIRGATRIATLVAFVAVTVPIAIAQDRFWSFTGTVADQTNRLVPEATLVLVNGSTRAKYEVQTDRAGQFEFVGLPAAEYEVAVQVPGFKTVKDAIAVAGKNVTRSFKLQLGTIQEMVNVTGPRQAANPDPAQQQAKLEKARQIRQVTSEKCAGAPADESGGRIVPPLKLIDVRPDYPDALKAGGMTGAVVMEARIGTDGTVRDVNVVSSPHPELSRLATDAVQQWEFSTTYLNCTPVEVAMTVTVNFGTK